MLPLKAREAQNAESVDLLSKGLMGVAVFVKGGLLGAYVPFFTLWVYEQGYRTSQVGYLSAVDALSSILLMPVIGATLDKYRFHNIGLVVILLLVAILKVSYLYMATSFVALLCLTALTAPLLKSANSVLDAQCLYAFPNKGEFPKVRMVGSWGFGAIALATGYFVDVTGNINAVFYCFAGLTFFGALYWLIVHRWIHTIGSDDSSRRMGWVEYKEQMGQLVGLVDWDLGRVMLMLVALGMCQGVIGGYEFILLQEMQATASLMGFCRLVGTFFEIPLWWRCADLIDLLGMHGVQLLCLAGNSARLVWYGTMTSPSMAVYAEVLHGCSFALPYASLCVFAGRLIPERVKGVTQAALITLFSGVGTGLGAILGGISADYLKNGVAGMFVLFGVSAFCVTASLLMLDGVRAYTGTLRMLS